MPNRIYWFPPPVFKPDHYNILEAADVTLPLAQVDTVSDIRPGPNWEESTSRFFWDDPTGTDKTVYRVQGFDVNNALLLDTGVFRPPTSFSADLLTRQRVDHNFGGVDNLSYYTQGGAPVPQAVVRVYNKPDFDAGKTDLALFSTETDNLGRFVTPFDLLVGMTYVLTYEKQGSYGPDKVEVTL